MRMTEHQGLHHACPAHLIEAFAFYLGDSEKHQVPATSGLVLSQGALGSMELGSMKQVLDGYGGS